MRRAFLALSGLILWAGLPAGAEARWRPSMRHRSLPAARTVTGEALLDPSLGDRDIDVCLEEAVQEARAAYDTYAAACSARGGTPAADPAGWTTNLVSFNEVTQLCTLDVRATCAPASSPPPHPCRR
jgi:hypothetical protein